MKSPLTTDPDLGAGSGKRVLPGFSRTLRQLAPTGLSLLVVLLFLFIGILYVTCTQYIRPDEFAVKQVDVTMPLLTGAAGIHTNIYDTGVHWLTPGCEKFLVFPKSIRAVTFHSKAKSEQEERFVRFEDAAHI